MKDRDYTGFWSVEVEIFRYGWHRVTVPVRGAEIKSVADSTKLPPKDIAVTLAIAQCKRNGVTARSLRD